MKYRKLPIVIEAFVWEGTNVKSFSDKLIPSPEWFNEALRTGVAQLSNSCCNVNSKGITLKIATKEGLMEASVGDYIIQGVNGELYPCKSDIFKKSYEPVEPETDNSWQRDH